MKLSKELNRLFFLTDKYYSFAKYKKFRYKNRRKFIYSKKMERNIKRLVQLDSIYNKIHNKLFDYGNFKRKNKSK